MSQSISRKTKGKQDVSLVPLITIVHGISEGVCWQSSLKMTQHGAGITNDFTGSLVIIMADMLLSVCCPLFKRNKRCVVIQNVKKILT